MTDALHIYWHPDCFAHDTGRGTFEVEGSPLLDVWEPHPENADRLRNVKSILERGPLAEHLVWHEASKATRTHMETFHDPAYLNHVLAAEQRAIQSGMLQRLDGSGTVVGPGTFEAMAASAGAGLDALDALLTGKAKRAYCLIRPPGHHAARATPDGSCIINNIGIVAEHARARGIKRIAVIDWDVHHGNGTEAGFYDRDDVFTLSMHMPLGPWSAFHPESGMVEDVGEGKGKGFNMNIALLYGSGDTTYEAAMREMVLPALDRFKPELVIAANGQDANQFDMNGRNLLSMAGFRTLGRLAAKVADRHSEGRLLLMQEGGYAISYTAFCAYAVAEGVLGKETGLQDPIAYDADFEFPEAPLAHLREIKAAWEDATGLTL